MRLKICGCCVVLLMLIAGASLGQGWQFAYQQELNIAFYGVHFPTSTVGYVVGGGGAIYKTTDAGNTWTAQTSPVALTLFGVYFKSATEGWAVGDNGVIIQTTDGTNWVENDSSQVMTTRDLNAVQFIGNKGWIGGDVGTLFLTNDNGVTWIPPTTMPYTDDLNDLSFVNSSIGYAAMDGDGIMYTVDGGVNWLAATVDLGPYPYTRDDIEVIMPVDDTTAVASGWGSMIGPQPTIILVSQDAGKTWDNPDDLYHWSTYGYGYGLGLFDDGEIILTGGGSGSAGFILHSVDNGATWTSSQAFAGEDIRACCTVPGTDRVVAVGDEGIFALSTDKGRTWSFIFDPGTGFNGWHDFVHKSSEMIIACGAQGHLIRLMQDDTGNPTGEYRFTVVSPQNWAPTILHDIDYLQVLPSAKAGDSPAANGTDILYVSGSNGYLCKSTDMGETWTQLQHTAGATTAIYKMHWFDENNGILVGEVNSQETIWRTVDGGNNLIVVWQDSTATSLQCNSISFAPENPLVGAICGDDSFIVYTNDGGTTWNWASHDLAAKPDLEEVHMVSATVGWIVGDGGTYLKTTDGGQSWFVQPTITSVTLMDVQFRYPDRPEYGWICGDNTEFYYTDDGGANWYAAAAPLNPTTKDVNSVHHQRVVGRLWIGADYGDILYRFNDNVTAVENPIAMPYFLGQNYPNPFNPSTTIKFTLPENDHVVLSVYDVRGALVARVLNKPMEAGEHTVRFAARGLASGVYFYRLKTSAGIQTKKMVLLR